MVPVYGNNTGWDDNKTRANLVQGLKAINNRIEVDRRIYQEEKIEIGNQVSGFFLND